LIDIDFAELTQYLINGLAQGAIYALIALGYTMVYGILQMINFAHGEFFMVGGMLGLLFIQRLHMPWYLGFPMAMLAVGGLAVLVERFCYRPLRNAGRIAPLITALGISIFILEAVRITAGAEPRSFPSVLEDKVYEFGSVVLQQNQIVILVVSLVLMAILHTIVMKTKVGRAMRALSVDFDACRLMGVNVDRIISLTFFIGATLAAVAGTLVGMYYNQVEPYMGQLAGLKAFTAAVLGGIGSIPGAVVGALFLGISEALVVGYGTSSYRDAIAFGILIVILMFRPWGLLGKPIREKV
jgi:branched-chain amino acid transport system permease protein